MSKPFLFPSLRYPLALWLATVLAFFAAFLFQLEPAQWTAITVWIVFIQVPTMNYSKVIWWAFGTIVGAVVAVVLIIALNQAPEVLLLTLAVLLSLWNAANTLVKGYKDYGFVLAGYTCGIVTMTALEHPDQIFRIAVTRVACIFVGMVAAIVTIALLLPKHRHWRQTQHQLAKHLHATLAHAAKALAADPAHPGHFTWRQLVDRLATLEHSLDITTAESPDARAHAPQARSLVATLFSLLADAQAIEVHLSRPSSPPRPRPSKTSSPAASPSSTPSPTPPPAAPPTTGPSSSATTSATSATTSPTPATPSPPATPPPTPSPPASSSTASTTSSATSPTPSRTGPASSGPGSPAASPTSSATRITAPPPSSACAPSSPWPPPAPSPSPPAGPPAHPSSS